MNRIVDFVRIDKAHGFVCKGLCTYKYGARTYSGGGYVSYNKGEKLCKACQVIYPKEYELDRCLCCSSQIRGLLLLKLRKSKGKRSRIKRS